MKNKRRLQRPSVVVTVPADTAPAAQVKQTAEISISKPAPKVAIDWKLRRKIHREKVQARRPAAATTTAKSSVPARPAQHLNPILRPNVAITKSLLRSPVALCVAAGVAACAAAAATIAEPGGPRAKAVGTEPLGGLAPSNHPPTTTVPVTPKSMAQERGLNTYPEFVRKYVAVQKPT